MHREDTAASLSLLLVLHLEFVLRGDTSALLSLLRVSSVVTPVSVASIVRSLGGRRRLVVTPVSVVYCHSC